MEMWINVRYSCLYGLTSLIILCRIIVVTTSEKVFLKQQSWTPINWIYRTLLLGNAGATYKGIPTIMAIYISPSKHSRKNSYGTSTWYFPKGIRKLLFYLSFAYGSIFSWHTTLPKLTRNLKSAGLLKIYIDQIYYIYKKMIDLFPFPFKAFFKVFVGPWKNFRKHFRASACAPRRNSHILWRSALSWSIFSSSMAARFSGRESQIFTCTQMLNVWPIYLHLGSFGINVGKYTIH